MSPHRESQNTLVDAQAGLNPTRTLSVFAGMNSQRRTLQRFVFKHMRASKVFSQWQLDRRRENEGCEYKTHHLAFSMGYEHYQHSWAYTRTKRKPRNQFCATSSTKFCCGLPTSEPILNSGASAMLRIIYQAMAKQRYRKSNMDIT